MSVEVARLEPVFYERRSAARWHDRLNQAHLVIVAIVD